MLQIKINKAEDLHVITQCAIVRDVLNKKYNKKYKLKKGYLNIDAFGTPACFTYFWLETDDGCKVDVIKEVQGIEEKYFLTEDILTGVECIDQKESDTTLENNTIWKRINTKTPYDDREYKILTVIINKHPVKNLI